MSLVTAYFKTLWRILTQPSAFFRELSLERKASLSGPLVFALVTHWLGSAFEFLWQLLVGGVIGSYLTHLVDIAGEVAEIDHPGRGVALLEMRDRILAWFWSAGPVVIDPFLTLASILFTTFFVYLGARLLVTPGERGAPQAIRYESALRVVCYGLTPSVLAAIPILGTPLSFVGTVIVTTIAAREIYRISGTRALVVALFPKLLLLGVVLSGALLALIVVVKAVTSIV